GEDGEVVDAEVDRGLDDLPHRPRSRSVARGCRQPPLLRPAAVAVHDDRHRLGDVRRLPGREGLDAPERPDARDQVQGVREARARRAQTSMIWASLRLSRSSILWTWSSVSFWTAPSARRSSSSPTCPDRTSSSRCRITSRRTLRTATRPSSAYCFVSLTS